MTDHGETGIESANHAVLCGVIYATLRLGLDLQFGVDVPETRIELLATDDGAYTNQIRVHRLDGSYLVTITPETARGDT